MQRHEWSLAKFKISQSTVCKNWKISAVEKSNGSTSRSKQRDEQKEITIFCSKNYSFRYFYVVYCNDNAIFAGFSLICIKVWVSFK